ncbi:MAG: hypothetical protein HC805_00640 [Alkalinema sp. RL_2_19]|nr:hypothetical protein [Alkalinema sp. RL_2_19]
MNISSMLARLQANLGVPNIAEQLLLIPPRPQDLTQELSGINLLVGYSNSENSQIALDLTLWIALQTRLATSKPVTVQVAYVTEEVDLAIGQTVDHPLATVGSGKASIGTATLAPAKNCGP